MFLLDPATRGEVTALLAYAEDAAGGLMNPRYARLRPDMSVDEAITYLRRQAREQLETIYYTFVLDHDVHLLGVVSFRELFAAPPEKTVRDIMHTGAAMPLMPLGTRMSDAILEMTTKGFGCVGIVDGRGLLVGIITDGDLRRHMRNNLLDARVDDVMTRSPKSVRPDQLLSETLDILNAMKVTALFAVEAGKPVGLVHVHDLLRTGAA
jgi:Mg/Co/Ni transporter MgtE